MGVAVRYGLVWADGNVYHGPVMFGAVWFSSSTLQPSTPPLSSHLHPQPGSVRFGAAGRVRFGAVRLRLDMLLRESIVETPMSEGSAVQVFETMPSPLHVHGCDPGCIEPLPYLIYRHVLVMDPRTGEVQCCQGGFCAPASAWPGRRRTQLMPRARCAYNLPYAIRHTSHAAPSPLHDSFKVVF